MKTIMRNLFVAAGLVFAASVSAQEAAPAAQLSDFSAGDTIVIKKDHERYLTGEKMSLWVYNVEHTIQQVGGKRFPEGILIRGIFSWVGPDDIVNKTTHPDEAAAHQKAKQKAEEEAQQAEQETIQIEQEQTSAQDSVQEVVETPIDTVAGETIQPVSTDTVAVVEEPKDTVVTVATEPAYVVQEEQKTNFGCDRFTIGIRGGAASLLQNLDEAFVDGKWKVGFDAMFDLQYAHYWKKFGKKMQYGLLVGVSAGYARSHITGSVDEKFRIKTSEGDIAYDITTDQVKEYDGQIQVEVPLMFSMIHENGFFMNIGPRFAVPVYEKYNQSIAKPNINAMLYPEEVPVHNQPITGVVTDEQAESNGKWKASNLNVMLGAEIGYEYTFKNKHSLGIGVYGNYSVYSLYKANDNVNSLIDITEAPSTGKNAVVTVTPATDAYGKGIGYFDVGLKLAYHFNWWKEK